LKNEINRICKRKTDFISHYLLNKIIPETLPLNTIAKRNWSKYLFHLIDENIRDINIVPSVP